MSRDDVLAMLRHLKGFKPRLVKRRRRDILSAKVVTSHNPSMAFLEALKGYKTYILAGLGIVVVILWSQGVIDEETAKQLLAALGFGSAISLRAGVKTEIEKAS